MTTAEIAELVDGKIIGEKGIAVEGVCSLAHPKPKHISFIQHSQNKDVAQGSSIQVFLVPEGIVLEGKTNIVVANPRLALAKVMEQFQLKPSFVPHIDPTAIVDPTAFVSSIACIGPYCVIGAGSFIGAGTVLRAHVHIGANCKIGDHCTLHPFVAIYSNTILKNRVTVHAHTVIGSDGFGYEKDENGEHRKVPQLGYVVIEEDVEIGAGVTIDRGMLDVTRIGAGTKIDNQVQIAHNVQIGQRCILVAHVGISGSVTIGDDCILGGQVGVRDHVTIVSGVVLAGRAGVTKSIQKAGLYSGFPAQLHEKELKMQAVLRSLPKWVKQRMKSS